MTGVQLGAFVAAFRELWTEEHAARADAKAHGRAFSGFWLYFWALALWAALYLLKTEAAILGGLLLGGVLVYVTRNLEAMELHWRAHQRLSQVRWKTFDMLFQWRAFGMWDGTLDDLKRLWNPDLGDFNFDSTAYREWWAKAMTDPDGRN